MELEDTVQHLAPWLSAAIATVALATVPTALANTLTVSGSQAPISQVAIAAPAHPTITASIGLAVTERGSSTTFADALVAADAAMYAAKHDGGNRIAISQSHPA